MNVHLPGITVKNKTSSGSICSCNTRGWLFTSSTAGNAQAKHCRHLSSHQYMTRHFQDSHLHMYAFIMSHARIDLHQTTPAEGSTCAHLARGGPTSLLERHVARVTTHEGDILRRKREHKPLCQQRTRRPHRSRERGGRPAHCLLCR